MLHTEMLTKKTFETITELMQEPLMREFFLVEGTNLALNIGHRKSEDIDMFTLADFDNIKVGKTLQEKYGFAATFKRKNTLKGHIDDIEIDCIAHKYPLVKPLVVMDGIRMASMDDISAMKLNAIVNAGNRLKDFVDIAALSAFMSFDEMALAYEKKYDDANRIILMKALTYYGDIDMKEPIQYIGGRFSWDKIENRLYQMIREPGKKFAPLQNISKTADDTFSQETGEMLISRFIDTTMQNRHGIGLQKSIEKAAREVLGIDKDIARKRKTLMERYIQEAGHTKNVDIIKYVKGKVTTLSKNKVAHKKSKDINDGYER